MCRVFMVIVGVALMASLSSCRSAPLADADVESEVVPGFLSPELWPAGYEFDVDPAMISREMLQKRVTVNQAWDILLDGESLDSVEEEIQASISAWWRSFTGTMKPGDEMWYWSTSPNSWKAKAGRAGLVIVRKGRFVRATVTLMN